MSKQQDRSNICSCLFNKMYSFRQNRNPCVILHHPVNQPIFLRTMYTQTMYGIGQGNDIYVHASSCLEMIYAHNISLHTLYFSSHTQTTYMYIMYMYMYMYTCMHIRIYQEPKMFKRGQLGGDYIIMVITYSAYNVHVHTCIYMHHSSCSPDEYKFPFLSGQY